MALEESNFAERFRKHLLPQQRRQVLLALRDKLDLDTSLGDIVDAAQRIGWGDALGELRLDELASAMYGEPETQAGPTTGFSADLASELARVLDARVARRRAKQDNVVTSDEESQARQADLKAELEHQLAAMTASAAHAQEDYAAEEDDDADEEYDDYDESYEDEEEDEDDYEEDYEEYEASEPVQEELELEDELTAALAAATRSKRGAAKRGGKKKSTKKKSAKKKSGKKKAGKKKAGKKKAGKKKAGRVGRPPKKAGKKRAGKKKAGRVGRPPGRPGKKKAGKQKAGKKRTGKKKAGRRRQIRG